MRLTRITLTMMGALLVLSAVASAQPDQQRQAWLRHLLKQDCGSCHGMTLKGGLGPPLTTEALQGKPEVVLVDAILSGRPGTAMPPWNSFLDQRDAEWLVRLLKVGLDNGEDQR